jgi:hypothetical protein
MAAAIPVHGFFVVCKSQIRFMHQRRRLQRLARLLLRHPLRRQLAQLVIYERQELSGRVRIAFVYRVD